MRTVHALIAAGQTDTGRQRDVNEDRFYCDAARGLFFVIDGVGGQAAGGKAADVALSTLRKRLERETEPVAERVRKAITNANDEIYRVARTRPEWNGMACVLTVAVVGDARVTIGHVGDTRMYNFATTASKKSPGTIRRSAERGGREGNFRIPGNAASASQRSLPRCGDRNITRSPNAEFIDIAEVPFEQDSAFLLCSDGLSDLAQSGTIANVINRSVGDPEAVAQTLIATANAAGGKDDITVVYVEENNSRQASGDEGFLRPLPCERRWSRRREIGLFRVILFLRSRHWPLDSRSAEPVSCHLETKSAIASIEYSDLYGRRNRSPPAIEKALPGSQILVEPGEYREQVVLKDGIRLMSRAPREATIRLPINVSDADSGPAVMATGLSNAELAGFRIVGDAATPSVSASASLTVNCRSITSKSMARQKQASTLARIVRDPARQRHPRQSGRCDISPRWSEPAGQ